MEKKSEALLIPGMAAQDLGNPQWIRHFDHAIRFSSRHLWQEHLKSGSSGRAMWEHVSHISQPPGR